MRVFVHAEAGQRAVSHYVASRRGDKSVDDDAVISTQGEGGGCRRDEYADTYSEVESLIRTRPLDVANAPQPAMDDDGPFEKVPLLSSSFLHLLSGISSLPSGLSVRGLLFGCFRDSRDRSRDGDDGRDGHVTRANDSAFEVSCVSLFDHSPPRTSDERKGPRRRERATAGRLIGRKRLRFSRLHETGLNARAKR